MEADERKTPPAMGMRIFAAVVIAIVLCGVVHRWRFESGTSHGLPSDGFKGATATFTKNILNNVLFRDHQIIPYNSTLEEEEEPLDLSALAAASDGDDDRPLRGASTFKEGDVVEIVHNRVLAPFMVTAAHSSDDVHVDRYDGANEQIIADYEITIHYDLVRLSDGFKIIHMPESSVRHYQPYEAGTKALCNLGGSGLGNESLRPCHVKDYLPIDKSTTTKSITTAGSTSAVLQNEYKVLVSGEEEYQISLPVSKLQRRNDHDT